MALYGITIVLSAFLLFLVQPLIGKYILPWFGGTPAVWTACMLFFLAALLGGYAYAHLLVHRLRPRLQFALHSALLALSLLALPIIPSEAWKPVFDQSPVIRILGLLLVTIGPPYLLLACTSPLLQSWFSRESRVTSPYRLYSLANLGALLAVISYPFVIEPSLGIAVQARIWSWSYAVFALLCILAGLRLALRLQTAPNPAHLSKAAPGGYEQNTGRSPSRTDWVMWFALAACGAISLLSTTNQMCLDVAVVPLLWILPLALYLLSFIICFHHERWYSRILFGPLLAAGLTQTCMVLFGGVFIDLRIQIASYSFTLFVCCMVCHGELARLKPAPRRLTAYYLMIAAGGAFGGLFVSAIAPHIFRGFWEYHVSLTLTAALFLLHLFGDRATVFYRGRLLWAWAAFYAGFLVLVTALAVQIEETLKDSIAMTRNFFGVLRVLEQDKDNPADHRLTLMHGRIEHGFQYIDPEKRHWPTSYFGPESGAGLAIILHPRRHAGGNGSSRLRIGVVGLGAGTLAAYGEEGDYIRFYEINPEVLRFSDRYFTYRRDSAAQVDVEPGDARVTMERERQLGKPAQFDVLAVDAFSSDAVPVHLLTRECFETYFYHLKDDGVLAVHISSRYFELSPIVKAIATIGPATGMEALLVWNETNENQGTDASTWVLLTRNADFLNSVQVRRFIEPWPEDMPVMPPWTDDYSNLFRLMSKKKD